MSKYYVNDNPQPTGEHEVHESECYWLKIAESKTYLGDFSSCQSAIIEAKKHYSNVDGCAHCCPSCHRR